MQEQHITSAKQKQKQTNKQIINVKADDRGEYNKKERKQDITREFFCACESFVSERWTESLRMIEERCLFVCVCVCVCVCACVCVCVWCVCVLFTERKRMKEKEIQVLKEERHCLGFF